MRCTAPKRVAVTATAASRTAAASASVRVRSEARIRSAYASDFLPSPIASETYTSKSRTSSSRSPAPSRSAASTSAAWTDASTISATSSFATGHDDTGVTEPGPGTRSHSRSNESSAAAVRGGSPYAWHTDGCSSPAWPTVTSPTVSRVQRPGWYGAYESAVRSSCTPSAFATVSANAIACCCLLYTSDAADDL